MPRIKRGDWASFAGEVMEVWERHAAPPHRVVLPGLSRREANAIKYHLYSHRLKLIEARDAGDTDAGAVLETAQHAYITISPSGDAFRVIIEMSPLKRALAALREPDAPPVVAHGTFIEAEEPTS